MKKILKLGILIPLFSMISSCSGDFGFLTKSNESEEETTKEETKVEENNDTSTTEEGKQEETKQEETQGESQNQPKEEKEEYKPNFPQYSYTCPLDGGDLIDENTPTKENSSSTTEEKPTITSNGFDNFHAKALEVHKKNISDFKVNKIVYYNSARSTISGTLLLDDGYVTRNVTSNWYFITSGDVFKIYDGGNEELRTSDPDNSFYPDSFRLTNVEGRTQAEKEKSWYDEIDRVTKANEGWSVNKYMYFYINTRAANLNEIIDSPYYSSLNGGKNYKFEYSVDNNGFYATRTTELGKTSYTFDTRGRMTKVVIKSNTAGQEDLTVNITYSTEVIR